MRILWIPQISSKSANGKILLGKDSNIAVLRNMAKSRLTEDMVIMFEFSQEDVEGLGEMHGWFKGHIIFNSCRHFQSAMLERFWFDSEYYARAQEVFGPFDVVFTNEPTKVVPLRYIFPGAVIATYNHWLAFKNMPTIELRQFEGMREADACFVNSEYAKDEICREFRYMGNNIHKIQPAYNGKIYPVKKNAKLNMVYNHRLSSDPYYSKAFKSLCKVLDILALYDIRPIVYLTNPSGKDIKLPGGYNFKLLSLPYDEYMKFLASDEVGIHINSFFESEGMWSMSTVDCAAAGNVCFLPYKYGYAEILSQNYMGYCLTESEMAAKIWCMYQVKNVEIYDTAEDIEKHNGTILGDKMLGILEKSVQIRKELGK